MQILLEELMEALHTIAKRHSLADFKKLFTMGLVPFTSECLDLLIQADMPNAVKILLQSGAKPSLDSLEYAIIQHNRVIIKMLIKHQAPITEKIFDLAIKYQMKAVVRLLRKKGAKGGNQTWNLVIQSGCSVIAKQAYLMNLPVEAHHLNDAIKKKLGKIVDYVLESGVIPTTEMVDLSIQFSTPSILKKLLTYGASHSDQSLELSIRKQSTAMVNILLRHGAQVTTPLIDKAITNGCPVVLVSVLKHNHTKLTHNQVRLGIKKGSLAIIRLLLEYNAPIPADSLLIAAQHAPYSAVKELIKAGAKGCPEALDHAIISKSKLLIEAALQLKSPTSDQTIDLAIKHGSTVLVKEIFLFGGQVTENTLNIAVQYGSVSCVRTAIDHGAKPNKDTLILAIKYGSSSVINTILDLDIEVSADILNEAICYCSCHIVMAVFKAGGKITSNSLDLAIQHGSIEMIRFIIKNHGTFTDKSVDIALSRNKLSILKLILNAGAQPSGNSRAKAVELRNDMILYAIDSALLKTYDK